MGKRMLVFDFRHSEKDFFESEKFNDFKISFFEGSLNEQTLKTISIQDKESTEIISVFIKSHINKEVLDNFKNLKLIATRSTGCNHINKEECLKHGVAITNVTNYGTKTVVQFTIGLLIVLVRKIIPAVLDIKKLENNSENYIGRNLNKLTIGVIGTGMLGAEICKDANFLGMKVLAYDIIQKKEIEEKYNVKYVDFETILKDSDIITLHIPYTDDNYHMFSTREFEKMKDTAYFINTSRGELVNTYALYKAIKDKKLQGCALDVGECEDLSFDMENFLQKIPETTHNCLGRAFVLQKMMELPNIIITPHIAYNTEEAINEILETTMKNIKAFYDGQKINRVV